LPGAYEYGGQLLLVPLKQICPSGHGTQLNPASVEDALATRR
jgi:hypothetical protein